MQRKYLITTLIIMAFIFIQSALPGDLSSNESNIFVQILVALFDVDADSAGFAVRKCAHFTEYLVLGGSAMLLFSEMRLGGGEQRVDGEKPSGEVWPVRRTRLVDRQWLAGLTAWAVGAAYAVTDEFHQIFVAGRSCEVRDMCIDAAGVLCGVLVIAVWRRRKKSVSL